MESLFRDEDALFQFTCLSAKDGTGAVTFKTAMKLRHGVDKYLRIAKTEQNGSKRQSSVNLKNRRR